VTSNPLDFDTSLDLERCPLRQGDRAACTHAADDTQHLTDLVQRWSDDLNFERRLLAHESLSAKPMAIGTKVPALSG
jgi:hypothetical protein